MQKARKTFRLPQKLRKNFPQRRKGSRRNTVQKNLRRKIPEDGEKGEGVQGGSFAQ
jgi:hypothetical protein